MISSTTRIQLIQNPYAVPATSPIGYLDVDEVVQVPVTYAVADIKDISKRSGTFSKTIKLPGTKNNNQLLGQLYEVNLVQGTFDINRLQYCNLLQNNIPVVENAYLQVVRVNKLQKGTMEDESVEYEVLIKDNASDFFTKLGSRELSDLDFTDMDHQFSAGQISTTFNNTVAGGYKYLAPWVSPPAPGGSWYGASDFKPAIYALKYWERIHAEAGYTYQWTTLGDPFVKFDQLLIPFNGGDIKITQRVNNAQAVIAERPAGTLINPVPIYDLSFFEPLPFTVEIQDPNSVYNPVTGEYTVGTPLSSPNSYDFTFELNWQLFVENLTGSVGQININNVGDQFRVQLEIVNMTTGTPSTVIPLTPYSQTLPVNGPIIPTQPWKIFGGPNNPFTPAMVAPQVVTGSITGVNAGDILKVFLAIVPGPNQTSGMQYYTIGSNLPKQIRPRFVFTGTQKMKITLNTETQLFGSSVTMNDYVPQKIKQSDFIKAICNMYNLYVEPDPNSKNTLIYRHRDDFYDAGAVVDWTEKLDREQPQILQFLPELQKKRLILTYKEDKDLFNSSYTQATKEIYGQQEIIFENEYIKDVDTRELLFSPTPMRITGFGAVAPLWPAQNPETNIRILIDNGQVTTQPYTIENYTGNVITPTKFPFASHIDAVQNPQFDINYGVCDYYFYDIGQYTNNNLYNLFWKRTMGQMNSGKMMTANFWLTPADIQQMKLNDKIRIDNSYWNINRIIDYNANARQLTRVELISIDNSLKLPRFGKESTVKPDWFNNVNPVPQDTVAPVRPPKTVIDAQNNKTKSGNVASSTINTDGPIEVMGKRNMIDTDFSGVVIGDNRTVRDPGYYVEDWALTSTGLKITGITIVDAGLDLVLPLDKRDPIDIIDAGLDLIRPYTNQPRTTTTRVILDGGEDRV